MTTVYRSVRGTTAGLAALALVLAAQTPATAQEQWKLGVGVTSNPGGGVRVNQVFDYSPAKAVGLKPGDVILAIGGTIVKDPKDARDKVYAAAGTIDITYLDGGEVFQVTAELDTVVAFVNDGGKQVRKETPKAKNLKKKKVPDPRRKK